MYNICIYIYIYIYYDCYILVPLIIDHKFFWCGVIILFQSLIYVSFFLGQALELFATFEESSLQGATNLDGQTSLDPNGPKH